MDLGTWTNIVLNLCIGLITTFLLFIVFEVSRRVPSLSTALFDNKRSIHPRRTPPPLMTTRCRADSGRRRWPSLLEFLFFSLSDDYINYSSAVNQDWNKGLQRENNVVEELDVESPDVAATERNSQFMLEPIVVTEGNLSSLTTNKNIYIPNNDSGLSLKPATETVIPYPPRYKHFSLPLDLMGPSSVIFLVRMMIVKDESRKSPRHLGSFILHEQQAQTLTNEDAELLRCVGLDSFIMLRFLRLGFEVCIIFFLLACIVLIPTYYTSDYTGVSNTNSTSDVSNGNNATILTSGYYRLTIDRLQPGSSRLVVPFLFAIIFHSYILLRWLIEWRIIVQLIHTFLADGDPGAIGEDDDDSLRQHRNSVLVENIPPLYRTNDDISDFFDKLFPGQVRRAEVLIDSGTLKKLIEQRQRHIESYETQYARFRHAWHCHAKSKRDYESIQTNGSLLSMIRKRVRCAPPKCPLEPVLYTHVGGRTSCRRRKVKALPFLLGEIEKYNNLIECEHKALLEKRRDATETASSSTAEKSKKNLNCGNGFVEFSNRMIKSSAIQCNLTGVADFMTSSNVPDPRDMIWTNATLDRDNIIRRHTMVDAFLGLGIVFWSAFVTMITGVVNKILADDIIQKFSVLGNLIKSYLPVLIISIILSLLPVGLQRLGCNVIRMRSLSEVDKYVFHWNFGYHIMNLCVILVSGTLIQGLKNFTDDPEAATRKFASGLLAQSQFYFVIVIIAALQTVPLQLSQIISVLYRYILTNVITLDALSERKKLRMNQPKRFLFGRFCPQFVYCFAIAVLFCTTVPLIMGICVVYFYLAAKVYMHQALFVFSQPYEGGGKLMKSLSLSLFVTVYISITVFAVVLSLKSGKNTVVLAPLFFLIMLVITSSMQSYINRNFIIPSRTLPLTRARLIDMTASKDNLGMICDQPDGAGMGKGQPSIDDKDNFYLYRQPEMNKATWETAPRVCTGLEHYYTIQQDNST